MFCPYISRLGALHYFGEILYAQASTLGYQDAFFTLGLIALAGLGGTDDAALPSGRFWRHGRELVF